MFAGMFIYTTAAKQRRIDKLLDKNREETITPTSHQPAFDPRNQELLLLDMAGGFQDRLQAGKEPVCRLDRVSQHFRSGQIVFLRLGLLGWVPKSPQRWRRGG